LLDIPNAKLAETYSEWAQKYGARVLASCDWYKNKSSKFGAQEKLYMLTLLANR
jgi:hypothetical protein